jgi:SAM-dependent methyltransferase
MIELLDCQVLGVDISPNMLALACSCVASERFAAMAPRMLAKLAPRCDAAISVWTLQHVLALEPAVQEIRDAMTHNAPLFVVNNKNRVVPSDHGWLDDGKDVHRTILDSGFTLIERGELEGDDIAPGSFADNTFWAAYRKA